MVAENKKTVDQAITEIDHALSLLAIPRREHVALVENLNLIVSIIKEHEGCKAKLQADVNVESDK